MKARIKIFCEQCDRELTHVRYMSDVNVDTADTPEDVQMKINEIILAHRGDCPYWGGPDNREPVNV